MAELLKDAWLRRDEPIEVLRPEVDSSGYDLVLECNNVIQHVQLKCSKVDGKVRFHKIQRKLASKPSACVVWILIEE